MQGLLNSPPKRKGGNMSNHIPPDKRSHLEQCEDTNISGNGRLAEPRMSTQALADELNETSDESDNPFPVDAFPVAIQRIIRGANEGSLFPTDFTGSGMIAAAGIAMGATYQVEVKGGWIERPIVYMALIGRPGTMKSPPMRFAVKPLLDADTERYRLYERQKEAYEADLRLYKASKKDTGHEEPIVPICERIMLSDATMESQIYLHSLRQRGIGRYVSELGGLFETFNQYRSGDDEQKWLALWDGDPVTVDRKLSGPIRISAPCVSLLGSMQPGILGRYFKGHRAQNGLLDRMLFAMPMNLIKEAWSDTDMDPALAADWRSILTTLLDLPMDQDRDGNAIPHVLKFSKSADELLREWQAINAYDSNAASEGECGMYSKLETYVPRLALILEMMRYACGDSSASCVDTKAMLGALELIEYYRNTGLRVRGALGIANPLDRYPEDKQDLYVALPTQFSIAEAIEIAENVGISRRTAYRFFDDQSLFVRQRRGTYKKRV